MRTVRKVPRDGGGDAGFVGAVSRVQSGSPILEVGEMRKLLESILDRPQRGPVSLARRCYIWRSRLKKVP
jgi:hypothetical protein